MPLSTPDILVLIQKWSFFSDEHNRTACGAPMAADIDLMAFHRDRRFEGVAP
jgi:hypothetical protein